MDILTIIEQTIEGHLADSCDRSVVHWTDIIHLICAFVGDYNIVKDLELRKISFENVIANTKYGWMRKISFENISKIEKRQERFFGISSPPGIPNSSCTGELSSSCGIEINVCKSLTEIPTFKGKFGSPTATPTSSEDF